MSNSLYNNYSVIFVLSRYHYPVPKIFFVQLSVGSHEFIGEGRTRQAARHNAAMKALQALRNEPIPNRPPQVKSNTNSNTYSSIKYQEVININWQEKRKKHLHTLQSNSSQK